MCVLGYIVRGNRHRASTYLNILRNIALILSPDMMLPNILDLGNARPVECLNVIEGHDTVFILNHPIIARNMLVGVSATHRLHGPTIVLRENSFWDGIT